MRLDWSNVGKGLSAVAQAKMDSDAGRILARNAPVQQYSPEQVQQMETAQGLINPETGRPYYQVSATPEGQYSFDAGNGNAGLISPQYRAGENYYETKQAGEAAARGLAAPELRDYWASKGSLGEDRIKALDAQRAAETGEKLVGLQTKNVQNALDEQAATKKKTDAIAKSYEGSRFFQVKTRNEAAQKAYETKLAEVKKLPPEQQVGKLPTRPIKETVSPIETIRDQMEALAVRQAHGEDVSGLMAEAAGVIKKIKDEGVIDALNVAHETGDPIQIADAYNKLGGERMDPSRIKTRPATIDVNGKKIKTFEVTIDEGAGKPPHTSYAYNDLVAALGADKAFERMIKQQTADAASTTAAASKQRAGLTQVALKPIGVTKDGSRPVYSDRNGPYVFEPDVEGNPTRVSYAEGDVVKMGLGNSDFPSFKDWSATQSDPTVAAWKKEKQEYEKPAAPAGDPRVEAQALIAAGRISLEDANKRLVAAGLAPLEVPAPTQPAVQGLTYGQQAAAARREAILGAPGRARAENEARIAQGRGLYPGR